MVKGLGSTGKLTSWIVLRLNLSLMSLRMPGWYHPLTLSSTVAISLDFIWIDVSSELFFLLCPVHTSWVIYIVRITLPISLLVVPSTHHISLTIFKHKFELLTDFDIYVALPT
jgi:hypothetical protein